MDIQQELLQAKADLSDLLTERQSHMEEAQARIDGMKAQHKSFGEAIDATVKQANEHTYELNNGIVGQQKLVDALGGWLQRETNPPTETPDKSLENGEADPLANVLPMTQESKQAAQ